MSSPLSLWTSRTSAANNGWYSVTYGTPNGVGLFVAVATSGTGNRVMTSPDGITWTLRTSPADNGWTSVTYGTPNGVGLFVAVAASGTNKVMTSPDGINWTLRNSPDNNFLYSVTYGPDSSGNGLFVAIGDISGTGSLLDCIITSPDGINWTLRTGASTNTFYCVTNGNGLFVAATYSGTGNFVQTSPNGINWTSRSSPTALWRSLTYGNGLFVAVASNSTANRRIMTSPDGITWTTRITSGLDRQWINVTYGDGLFVAVAVAQGSGTVSSNNRSMVSSNGINWSNSGSSSNNAWTSVAYGNGRFVAVSTDGSGNRVMTANTLKPTLTNFTVPTKSPTDGPFTLTPPTSNSSGAFSYSSSNTSVATISGSTVTIIGAGTSIITATQAATADYASGDISANFVVSKPAPTLSNFSVPTKVFGDAPFTLTDPSSNSSGAFSYSSSNTSVATIAGNTVTIVGAGTSIITATQAATASYSSGDISANFVVNQATTTLSNFSVPTKTFGDAPFALTAPTSNRSGAFSYSSSNTSVATISGSTVTIVGVGTSIITATQAATTNYTTGDISANFVVGIAPTLSNFSIDTTTLNYPSFIIPPPTSNSDGLFTYTSTNPAVATISGNIMTIVGPGNTTIIATQAATATYNSATISTTFAEYFHLCKNWNFHFHGNSAPYNI